MATDYLINVKDADLMQMMYEQDVDLGFDWHHLNEPAKQIKEIDDISKEKNNNSFDIGDFFVDGETGEHIPIAQNQSQQPPAIASHPNNYAQPTSNPMEANNALNIEDCLEILENSFDDIQPQRLDNQLNGQNQSHVIKNLTSLIDTTDNSTITQPNEDIWQQIAGLSDLTGMNLQGRNPSIVNANVSLTNATIPQPGDMIQQPMVDEPFNVYNQINYKNDQQYNPPAVFEPQLPQYSPVRSFPSPTYSPPVHTPATYDRSPISSEDGMPMDIGFSSPDSSPNKQEQNFLFNQMNNFNYGMESGESPPYRGSSPLASSFPEPGQGFFDQPNDASSGLSELVSMNSNVPSFSNNVNGSYLNPPLSQYHPPPLNATSPPLVSFPDEPEQAHKSTVDKSAISEYCESDSGISLDQSPNGYGFLGSNIVEETPYLRDSQHSDRSQGYRARELKAIQHNHTYDGTVGAKKPLNRKKEQKLQTRESRDERKARELNLPFTLDEIILSPVEDYNEMLVRTPLNPAQQALIKDIRRRGKNKVAAQNCRKRKIETISNMEDDVDLLRTRRQQLVDEQNDLESQKENMKLRYNSLYQRIFSSLRDDAGRPYDPNHFRLEQVEGAVLLVPRLLQDGHLRNNQSMEQDDSNGNIDFSKVKLEKRQ